MRHARSNMPLGVLLAVLCLTLGCAHSGPSVGQRATLLSDKGRASEAAKLLQDYLVEHPDAVGERRLLVRILAADGRLDRAEREVARLSEILGEGSPIPWIELGHAFELNHRYEQALAQYDRAAIVAPQDPAGPLTGGMRAARWGEVELAAPRLEEALRRDPTNSGAWHALGLVRFHAGDASGARTAYDSGLQADPTSIDNRLGLATVALAEADFAEALRQYDAILEVRPGFGDAYLGRSFVLIKLGRLEEASDSLDAGYRLGANPEVVARQRALLEQLGAQADRSKPKRIR